MCNSFTIVASAVCARYTRTRDAQRSACAMKTTLTPQCRISPYKGSVATVQIQMPLHAVGRSFSAMDSSTLNSSTIDSSAMDSSAIGVGVTVLVSKCMQGPCSTVPDIQSIK